MDMRVSGTAAHFRCEVQHVWRRVIAVALCTAVAASVASVAEAATWTIGCKPATSGPQPACPADDFPDGAAPTNPDGAWTLMYSLDLTRTSSGNFRKMTTYDPDYGGVTGANYWQSPTFSEPGPLQEVVLGKNNTGTDDPFGLPLPRGAVGLHPLTSRAVVLAWTSPIDGVVNVSGAVTDGDPSGDGIDWHVLRAPTGPCGAPADACPHASALTELTGGDLPNGAQQFSDGSPANALNGLSVATGNTIYVVVGPGSSGDYFSDSTVLNVKVSTPNPCTMTAEPNVPTQGTPGNDYICGTADNDVINGNGGHDTIKGSAGNDTINGGTGADTVYGGAHDDIIDGGVGADQMFGEAGLDEVTYAVRGPSITATVGANDTVVTPGNDGAAGERDNIGSTVEVVTGGNGTDTLTGNANDNFLRGGPGNDILSGLGGSDRLDGGLGSDTLKGGSGIDGVSYDGDGRPSTTTIWASIGDTATDGANDGAFDEYTSEGDDIQADIEHVVGGPGQDILVGSDGENVLDGSGGHDEIFGGGGDDMLVGGATGNEKLYGEAGYDKMIGGNGADTFWGGPGVYDRVSYAAHNYLLGFYQLVLPARTEPLTVTIGAAGGDGGPSDGTARDDIKIDVEEVIGGDGNDTITGSSRANFLSGAGGADTLRGGRANDELIGGAGGDTLYGDQDEDSLEGWIGDDTLYGGAGADSLSGWSGADILRSNGDGAADQNYCGDEVDTLYRDPIDFAASDCENKPLDPPAITSRSGNSIRKNPRESRWADTAHGLHGRMMLFVGHGGQGIGAVCLGGRHSGGPPG